MTDNDLKRGIKLRREIDALTNHRETLEMMKEMCSEGRNASSTKEFVLKVNNGQKNVTKRFIYQQKLHIWR